ncbi:hypothetical protein N9Y42_09355 [Mariniblastus sp.]|nr:hypothetical protein [Mariniblastus sp.]
MLQKRILNQIEKLGGHVRPGKIGTLAASLRAITIPHALYKKDSEIYGIQEKLDSSRKLYDRDRTAFFKRLESQCLKRSCPYADFVWKPFVYSPLTKGSKHYDSMFGDPSYNNLTAIRSHVGYCNIEFLMLSVGFGVPDNVFICLQDPAPENPTVFGTDHEQFFSEISPLGKMADFLKQFCTPRELRSELKSHVETFISYEAET